MRKPRLYPLARLIERYGIERLSSWADRHHSRLYRWAQPFSCGGFGGWVPLDARERIRTNAAKDGVFLALHDFEPWPGEANEPFEVGS